MTRGSTLLAALLAVGVGLGAAAPWTGRADLFAALAAVQAALAVAVALAGRALPGGRRGLALLVAAAALVRAPLLLAPPTLSDDVHRYVLDGRLWTVGVDAYRVPPEAARVVPGLPVNHPHLATIYPPFAEAAFTALAAAGLDERGFRAFFALCDLATTALLGRLLLRRGKAPWAAALFALHPLAALESAGSGHADALGLAFLALAWERSSAGRRGPSALALAAAVGVKPIALLAAPFLFASWGRARSLGFVVLAAAQYAVLAAASARAGEASGLAAYLATWRHNDLLFSGLLASGLALTAAKAILAASTAGLALVLARRRTPPVEGYAWCAALFLALSPVLHPWYALGLLVAAPALERHGPRAGAWALATAVLATYVLPAAAGDTPGFRVLPLSTRLWELGPVLVLFALEAGAALRARRPSRARPVEEPPWNGSPSAKAS